MCSVQIITKLKLLFFIMQNKKRKNIPAKSAYAKPFKYKCPDAKSKTESTSEKKFILLCKFSFFKRLFFVKAEKQSAKNFLLANGKYTRYKTSSYTAKNIIWKTIK